jgi:uncharacterized protein YaiL (DUF2058 family)
MANAFQEQLLKAGLVSKDKVNKSNKSRYKQAKQQPKNRNSEADKIKQQVKQATLTKTEHDRELNRKKVEADNKKAIAMQIKQLIEMNLLSGGEDAIDEDEVAYNFEVDNKIERIYVTDDLHKQIVNGRLAIVRLGEKYELIPKIVADKIMQRDNRFVVLCNEAAQVSDEDHEYADYNVPDDLMW